MKYLFNILFIISSFCFYAQDIKTTFSDFYEEIDGKFKIYIDNSYKLKSKECSDYYVLCNINNQFEFIDSVKVFNMKNKIISKGFFSKSKLQGNFIKYFTNGQIEIIGKYEEGIRIGIWKFFYKNGNIKKIIDFNDGKYIPTLNEFYKENGKNLIVNGTGKYEESIIGYSNTLFELTFNGTFKNGLMEGSWLIENKSQTILKEMYRNGELIEGFSIPNNEKYYQNPIASFIDINFLELIKIHSPSMCSINSMVYSISENFYTEIYNILKQKLDDFNNSRYFVKLMFDKNEKFIEAFTLPENKKLNTILNKELIGKVNKSIITNPRYPIKSDIILLLFKDDVFFDNTKKIENFILN